MQSDPAYQFCGPMCTTIQQNSTSIMHRCNKLCAWQHNMPPPTASWQYLRIYSPGGSAVPTWHAGTGATWQINLRIYSPGGTSSGMLAVSDISNKLTFDLLTLKVVSKSRVTWATFVSILVFLDLSVLELAPMYATDRQTSYKSIA